MACFGGNMTRSSILYQIDASQLLVVFAKKLQFGQVVFMVIVFQEDDFHQSGMHYQEQQHVDCSMTGVIEFLLFNRAGNRSPNGITFQHLKGRDLVDTHDPDTSGRQPSRIPIAPKDLLRSFFERSIQPRRLPLTGAMRLQVDIAQNPTHRAWADGSNNPVGHRLPSQVSTGPMRDVQFFGHRFQASESYDLRPLHRGNLQITSRMTSPLIAKQAGTSLMSIALTSSPNRGFTTVALRSQDFTSPPRSDSQNNSSTTNLKPGRYLTPSDPLQFRTVRRSDVQFRGSTSTHGDPSSGTITIYPSPFILGMQLEFRASFDASDTSMSVYIGTRSLVKENPRFFWHRKPMSITMHMEL
jgi:hypothetical protein